MCNTFRVEAAVPQSVYYIQFLWLTVPNHMFFSVPFLPISPEVSPLSRILRDQFTPRTKLGSNRRQMKMLDNHRVSQSGHFYSTGLNYWSWKKQLTTYLLKSLTLVKLETAKKTQLIGPNLYERHCSYSPTS